MQKDSDAKRVRNTSHPRPRELVQWEHKLDNWPVVTSIPCKYNIIIKIIIIIIMETILRDDTTKDSYKHH